MLGQLSGNDVLAHARDRAALDRGPLLRFVGSLLWCLFCGFGLLVLLRVES